jgi:uncharacterized integral membrane protein
MGLKKFNAEEVKNEETSAKEETVENKEIEEGKIEVSGDAQSDINELIATNVELEKAEEKVELSLTEDELVKKVNAERDVYYKYSKKQKIYNYICTGILIALIIAAFALILTLGQKEEYSYVMWISLSVVVVGLIGSFAFSRFQRKKLEKAANTYINNYFTLIDKHIYEDERFSKQDYFPSTQMEDRYFVGAHFYNNIKSTRSRNFVSCTYNDKTLVSADLAGNIMVKNRLSPMFLGRYFVYQNDFKGEDKYIVFQLKGGQLSRPIDNIDDLKLVEGNNYYCIYTNIDDWKRIFNSKVLNELKRFKINNTLIDVLVSIREGYTSLGIDYSDEFMNVAVDHEFKFDGVRVSQKDLEIVLNVLDIIGNNIKGYK